MDVEHEVRAFIEAKRLLSPGDRVTVGVSGGADSVALLHLLRSLAEPLSLQLHVAHLHHGLRGADADADAQAVQKLAQSWNLPFTMDRVDLAPVIAREKLTVEEAARRARYAFLCRVAAATASTRVAVAHNADDQAETVLMHVLRGAGPAGLRGMLPATCLRNYHLTPFLDAQQIPADLQLIRPLLEIPRTEIERYCAAHGLHTRFDRSNLDTTFFRNRLRLEVLPYLEDVSPQISLRLRNLAQVVQADYAWLQEQVSAAREALLVAENADAVTFDLRQWRAQPLAIQRAIVRQSAYELRPSLRDVDFVHVENAVSVARLGPTGAQATLPQGLCLTVGYQTLTIGDAALPSLPPERPWLPASWEAELQIPSTVQLEQGWSLEIHQPSRWSLDEIACNPDPCVASMDLEALGAHPLVRTRRLGDRFVPQGMAGAELRLSDFLINAKVPRRWREHLPLVEGNGSVLWVAGVRLSELALVRPTTRDVVQLRFSRHEGGECLPRVRPAASDACQAFS